MAQNGAVFVFCSSCKIFDFASSVHPGFATALFLSYSLFYPLFKVVPVQKSAWSTFSFSGCTQNNSYLIPAFHFSCRRCGSVQVSHKQKLEPIQPRTVG